MPLQRNVHRHWCQVKALDHPKVLGLQQQHLRFLQKASRFSIFMEPVVKLCKASMRQKPASVSLRGLGIFCIGDCVSNDCRQNSNPREKEDQMHQHDSVSRRKHSPQRMDLSMRFGFRCFQSDLRAKIKWQDFRTFQPVTESKCIHSTTVLH